MVVAMDLRDVSDDSLLLILQFLGPPECWIGITEVCHSWRDLFRRDHSSLWARLAQVYKVSLPSSSGSGLRSKTNAKRLFLVAYQRKKMLIQEKHDLLLFEAKKLLEKKRDTPKGLRKLIMKLFRGAEEDFNVNYRCEMMEKNSLSTLTARYCHLKCLRLVVEYYHGEIDQSDVGGFTPLILFAYHGNIMGVQYCIQQGACLSLSGSLRSDPPLTAEHWAAVRGFQSIFLYLRALRRRQERGQDVSKLVVRKRLSAEQRQQLLAQITATDPEHVSSSRSPSGGAAAMSTASHSQGMSEAVTQGEESIIAAPTTSTGVDNNSSNIVEEGSFCVCGKGFIGEMIACDAPSCLLEWYHLPCVGLYAPPKAEESWHCPPCRGEAFKQPLTHTPQRAAIIAGSSNISPKRKSRKRTMSFSMESTAVSSSEESAALTDRDRSLDDRPLNNSSSVSQDHIYIDT